MLDKWKNWFARKGERQRNEAKFDPRNIPVHVAIIMDGNGRWARKRNLPRMAGHRAGMKTVREITCTANELGIKVLTLYAFSTENWKRPREEVEYLMRLPLEFLQTELDELKAKNVRLRMIGYEEGLPPYTLEAVRIAQRETQGNTGLILNFALNYGSRYELTNTVVELVKKVQAGELKADEIDEATVSSHLLTKGLPDPDLLIRTSGEIRLSNFMLWQLAYTELWFTDVLWPDFTREHFIEAIREYQRRTRRYGGV
ncbi:isoprenyl transferase [Bacillaceae bacterium]